MKTRTHALKLSDRVQLARVFLSGALALLLVPVATLALAADISSAEPVAVTAIPMHQSGQAVARPRIQLAILLDTSNSMDGLIEQTRNQLWQVVNQFALARQDGVTPLLEIALFEYGNSDNPGKSGYLRQLNGFTRELDAVSQGLFSLTTNGGDEFCGYAIDAALHRLQWSRSTRDIKMIFIAGNESFDQGPLRYQDAVQLARQMGVSVNTIHAGSNDDGIRDGWRDGAVLAGGDYLSIDANQQVVHLDAPQDARIAELNAKLNSTYLPYGTGGAAKAQRQLDQDQLSSDISAGLLAKRAGAKASEFYGNADWDLVDAFREGEVADEQLQEIEESALPEPMRGMSAQQKLHYLQQKQIERDSIQMEILELSKARANYAAARKLEQVDVAPGVSDALTGSIRKQAQQKNFTFDD